MSERYRRRSARVLLLDEQDRLLLFRNLVAAENPTKGGYWLTPGGGVDKGEDLASAAARELREETGLVVTPAQLGPVVAETSGWAEFSWAKGVFRDDFFFLRVEHHDVDTAGFQAVESELFIEHRWWPPAEIPGITEPVYPWGLAELAERLLSGWMPEVPVTLPWHH